MNNPRNSLSGENEGSLPKRAGSSPASSTISKQRLWRKLQSLDRKISKLAQQLMWDGGSKLFWGNDKLNKGFIKLDQERKEVRMKLKSHKR